MGGDSAEDAVRLAQQASHFLKHRKPVNRVLDRFQFRESVLGYVALNFVAREGH